MSVSTCRIATVEVPVEHVWRLLADPYNYALWWDAETCWQFADGAGWTGQAGAANIRASKSAR